jgi:hypothetical protein
LSVTEEACLDHRRRLGAARQRTYLIKNRDKQCAATRKWRAESPDKNALSSRKAKLKQNYGISLDQFADMLAAQDHACAICGTKEPKGRGCTFHVDHCHTTGVVRGLLCHHCNVGLGNFRDDPERLTAALQYLATREALSDTL